MESSEVVHDLYLDENWMLRLCRQCRAIDFGALRCPTFTDLSLTSEDALSANTLNHFNATESYPPRVPLGTLQRIKNSADTCTSCKVLWSVIAKYDPALEDPSTGRDRECFASVQIVGSFRSKKQQDGAADVWTDGRQNAIRRLSLRIGVPPDEHEDDIDCIWWDIFFCVQATGLGNASLSPDSAYRSSTNNTALAFGGRLRPLVLELQWLRDWLHICESAHGGLCQLSRVSDNAGEKVALLREIRSKTTAPQIRLINVKLRCLEAFGNWKEASGTLPAYVALSYVWGKDQPLKLKCGNQKQLMVPGAFFKCKPSQTIADAIDLLEQLGWKGVEHLWVDALCILQDNDQDKQRQIGSMNRIYAEAAFTIIAEAGDHADFGLPGFRAETRTMLQSFATIVPKGCHTYGDGGIIKHTDGLGLMEMVNPLPDDNEEFWSLGEYSTRGWTMQERVMSRRKLIFTKEQVYWQCASALYSEESHMEVAAYDFLWNDRTKEPYLRETLQRLRDAGSSSTTSRRSLTVEFWNQFAGLATRFSFLQFTNEGDVVDGFSGIMQAVTESSGEEFLWGIPHSRFDLGLLWIDQAGVRRRTARTTLPVTAAQQHLRMPSWSWFGWQGVEVRLADDRGSTMVSDLVCYIHRPCGRILDRVGAKASDNAKSDMSPHDINEHTDKQVTIEQLAREMPILHKYLPGVPDGILLFFWASVSSFRVHVEGDHFRLLSAEPADVENPPPTWDVNNTYSIDGVPHRWVGSLYGGGDGNFTQSFAEENEEKDVWDVVLVGRQPHSAHCNLIVMVIGYRFHELSGRIAMRLALGSVIEDAWITSRPRRKLLALG